MSVDPLNEQITKRLSAQKISARSANTALLRSGIERAYVADFWIDGPARAEGSLR
jgi:hypothetical protein